MPAKSGIGAPVLVGEIIPGGGEEGNATAQDEEGHILAEAEGTNCTGFYLMGLQISFLHCSNEIVTCAILYIISSAISINSIVWNKTTC